MALDVDKAQSQEAQAAGSELSAGLGRWEPMATAPKDGSIVLLFRPKNGGLLRFQSRVTAIWSKSEKAWIWPDDPMTDIEFDDRSWVSNGDYYRCPSEGFTHWTRPIKSPGAA